VRGPDELYLAQFWTIASALVSQMPLLYGEEEAEVASSRCQIRPEVTATEPDKCPKCGMKLAPPTLRRSRLKRAAPRLMARSW
jgi:hypothetical protein